MKVYKKYIGKEEDFQTSVAKYLDSIGALWFHPPNGGIRDKGTARKLKKQGVKAGVPDICIMMPRFQYHGLFIELKNSKGTTTVYQDRWLSDLQNQGYLCKVSNSLDETIDIINRYLSIK